MMALRTGLGCTAMVIFLGINVLGTVMRPAKAASRRQIEHKEGSALSGAAELSKFQWADAIPLFESATECRKRTVTQLVRYGF